MDKKAPAFEYASCIACGICAQGCPVSCIMMTKTGLDKWNKLYPELGEAGCIGCGTCAKSCPMDAIEMKELND